MPSELQRMRQHHRFFTESEQRYIMEMAKAYGMIKNFYYNPMFLGIEVLNNDGSVERIEDTGFEDWLAKLVSNRAKTKLDSGPEPNAYRIKWLIKQLDIVRGRVPTPKGYTADPETVKAWIKELQELTK